MNEQNVTPNAAQEEENLIEQAKIRREKLAKLIAEGKNPYEQVKYEISADSAAIKADYEQYEAPQFERSGQL